MTMLLRIFIVIIVMIFVASCGTKDESVVCVDPSATARVIAIRQLYFKAPAELLGVVEPIEVLSIIGCKCLDGGNSITFRDAVDGEFTIKTKILRMPRCPSTEKHKMPVELLDSVRLSLVPNSESDFIWPGFLPRGPEESALYGILIRWSMMNPLSDSEWRQLQERQIEPESIILGTHQLLRGLDFRFWGYTSREYEGMS